MPSYYCTALDIAARWSSAGKDIRLDDDPSAISNVLQNATNKIRFYCADTYAEADLLADADDAGWVNDRATDLACVFLGRRRGNTVPDEIKEAYREAVDELERVHDDIYEIPGVPKRHAAYPTFSNIRVDPRYDYRKVRVEKIISEASSPSSYVQIPDWTSQFIFEY